MAIHVNAIKKPAPGPKGNFRLLSFPAFLQFLHPQRQRKIFCSRGAFALRFRYPRQDDPSAVRRVFFCPDAESIHFIQQVQPVRIPGNALPPCDGDFHRFPAVPQNIRVRLCSRRSHGPSGIGRQIVQVDFLTLQQGSCAYPFIDFPCSHIRFLPAAAAALPIMGKGDRLRWMRCSRPQAINRNSSRFSH